MINLRDVTFVIPVSIDHDDRKFNITLLLDYLNHHFDTNILVGEEGTNELRYLKKFNKCTVESLNFNNGPFHRTRVLNTLFKLAKTDIVVNYDADVFFLPEQYHDAANMIRTFDFDMVYPYAGPFMDVKPENFGYLKQTYDITQISKRKHYVRHPESKGGAIFFKRSSLIEGGMENEKFRTWGWEDDEREKRFEKLGYKIGRTSGNLYHLIHRRNPNDNVNHPDCKRNQQEVKKVDRMTVDQLEKYIKTWPWTR